MFLTSALKTKQCFWYQVPIYIYFMYHLNPINLYNINIYVNFNQKIIRYTKKILQSLFVYLYIFTQN